MNYATSTETVETVSTDTSSRKSSVCWSTSMSKEQAHKLLNEVKAGVRHHPLQVTKALIATGDWI